jgi:ATP-binding cassette, subfamily B, bacterial PglK
VIEVIGVSAIMPLIDTATDLSRIQSNIYYKAVFDFFVFEREVDFVITFALLLFVFYFLRGGINIFYSYSMAKYSQVLYAETTKILFKTYLTMPYNIFVKKNSSYLTKTIITEASLFSSLISSILLMISEIFIITFLYALMLFTNWKVTTIFTLILSFKVLLLTKTISRVIKSVGKDRAVFQEKFYEILNRTFGNYKNIKLQDRLLINKLKYNFNTIVDKYANVSIINTTLQSVPRILLETLGFGLVTLSLTYLLYENQSNILYVLPTLSFFVLAMYRILPSVNRILTGYNTLMFYHKSIDIVSSEIEIAQENLGDNKISFKKNIVLKDVDFYYQDAQILSKINLVINKGDKIAFIGESGSGKSTLVDLIIGIHNPKIGSIFVDGVLLNKTNLQDWRSKISYIPQQIYLFDGTVAENVCFGRELDKEHLVKILKQANILNFLQKKQGLNTLVGEGGIQLSGGQKQRIAIARALYGSPEVLVLDEATSALDDKIEQKIMDEIYRISINKTLIIVAHRLSTIENCNKVYKLNNGAINV